MMKKQELRQLKDYEVLGVGAVRREKLLANPDPAELVTHKELVPTVQASLYEAVLTETLKWLQPASIRPVKLPVSQAEFLLEVLLEEFKREFPCTAAYLKGGLRELLKDYLKEVPWQGPLASAHFRYLPVFLKRKLQDSRLYLIAQKEWLQSYLSFADFGFPPSEPGRLIVNPSLQSLYTAEEVAEVELSPGLSIFYFDYSLKLIRDYKMDLWDAAIADLLQEDRKFTLEQLLDQLLMMELDSQLSRGEWAKKISYLRERGILWEFGP
jgi:hypothetical protein